MKNAVLPGLRRGGEMLVGMPGDVNAMTQSVAGRVSRALFGDKVTDEIKDYVPVGLRSEGVTTKDVQDVTNKAIGPNTYEPQTTPGRYTERVMEQVPGAAIGPGKWTIKGLQALFGGLGSEAAGDLTKGTAAEPYARAAGALVGNLAPGAAAERLATVPGRELARDANVATLQREGVPLSAGQITGSKTKQFIESELGGGAFEKLLDKQRSVFTQAAMRRLGESGDSALPEDLLRASANIGQRFDQLATSTTLPFDQDLQNGLLKTAIEYRDTAPAVVPAVEGMMNRMAEMAATNGGRLTGQNYQELTTKLRTLGEKADGPTSTALDEFRDVLDDAMERTMSGDQLAAWQQARRQWANLKTVQRAMTGAGEDAANGMISPVRLRTAITGGGNGPEAIAEGRSGMTDLANAGVGVMKGPPNSGTAARLAARAIPAGIAAAAAGAAHGDWLSAGVGALGGMAFPEIAGKAVMNPISQGLLRGSSNEERRLLAALMAARLGAGGQQ